ncbi:MAG: hypothetical protein LC753_06750 [Acidobacteria bacterium]|nr:hypothetical protein [Acidobacteriota bacterium]MCA1649984.1 hypothetical protein [Acidobacteriota bacterium]
MRAAALVTIVVVALLGIGCDDSPTNPTRSISGSGTSTGLNLTGTWSGTASDSSGQLLLTWRLTQSATTVTGTVTATTTVGAPLYTGGTLTGTTTASALTFTFTIPRGGISPLPNCSATFSGTAAAADITATGMSGTYSGSDTCGGTYVSGRFTLIKQ